MILEFLIEYDKESILGYKKPIMNQLLKILEVLKEKFDGRGNYAFLYLIGIKSINREKWDKRFYNSNWKFKTLYIIIIFLFGILLFIFEGMNAIVPLIVLFPTFFWAILLSNILFLILKTKAFPVLIKLMISLLIGVFCGIVYFSAVLMLFPFGIAGVVITLVTILLVLYFRNIGKFTDGGARIKKDLEGFKMYVKSGEVKKFNDVEELISYFKKILPFSQALKVQKHVVEMIKKSIEISGLEDKKEYIENTLNIFIYKNDKFMKSFGNEIFAKEILEKASNEALEGNYYEEF